MSVLEPLEHSVLGVSLEGGDESVDEVARLHPLEDSGVDRITDLISGMSVLDVGASLSVLALFQTR